MHDVDVVIVGCGPVGAFAANLFGQAGYSCLVLEKSRGVHALPRAVHIDHEMMRLLHRAGLEDLLRPLMREAQGNVHVGADGDVIRYLGTAGKPRRFGWANDYFFFQPELEAHLRACLARYDGVVMELGSALRGLAQDGEGVTLTVADADGSRQVRAKFVIGCDGARSTVRKALGVGLADLDFEEPWLVVDAEVDGRIRFPPIGGLPADADLQELSVMMCDPRRPATIVPGRGAHRRWEFMLLPGEDDEAMMQPEAVQGLVKPWVEGADHNIIRAATYRFHGLVAEQWSIGRVFLAGDAAHQTPPFFGQGMCHGFRDAANLAWKLDLVLKGSAAGTLMETYQVERDPQVRAVIGLAIEAGRYICELDPEAAALRDESMRTSDAGRAAPDLIPPYRAGIVREGGGERFIQPFVLDHAGRRLLLDSVTGFGFVLLVSSEVAWTPSPAAAAVIETVGLRAFVVHSHGDPRTRPYGQDSIIDEGGDLLAWLAERDAAAVLVRPDAYVHGLASSATGLDMLVTALGSDLCLVATSGLQEEPRQCSA